MKKLSLSVLLIILTVVGCRRIEKSPTQKNIIGYFPQWGVRNNYTVKSIVDNKAADKLSVINYAFAIPNPDSSGMIVPTLMNSEYDYLQNYSAEQSIDGVADDSIQIVKGHFNQLKKLKLKYPNIKLVISLGGWTGSKYFSVAAQSEENRKHFVDSTISLFIKGNLPIVNGVGGKGAAKGIFDGIDIDWEYPGGGGLPDNNFSENDKDNLTELFKLFRKKLDEIDSNLILSTAVPSKESVLNQYNIEEDQKVLDYYQLMTYDFYGGWDPINAHHTNITRGENSFSPNSMDSTVNLFLNKYNVEPSKIVVGAAFYGRGWQIKDSANSDVLFNKAEVAKNSGEPGYGYYKYLRTLNSNGWKYFWDDEYMAPYIYNENTKEFWSFDDEQSVALKSQYTYYHNLGGVMFWELSGDDTSGTLINAIFNMNTKNITSSKNFYDEEGDVRLEFSPALKNVRAGNDLVIKAFSEMKDIIQVDFYCDDKLIGSDNNSTFRWMLFNLSIGEHQIFAKFYSSSGKVFTTENYILKVIK